VFLGLWNDLVDWLMAKAFLWILLLSTTNDGGWRGLMLKCQHEMTDF